MCVWDHLKARATGRRFSVALEKSTAGFMDLDPGYGCLRDTSQREMKIEARLMTVFLVGADAPKSVIEKHEEDARRRLASLLYEDALDLLRHIEEAVITENRAAAIGWCEKMERLFYEGSDGKACTR